jgi:tetratricopeptide (TPR) repeat protein
MFLQTAIADFSGTRCKTMQGAISWLMQGDEAISFIKQAIQLQPRNFKFRGTLGIAYEQCKRYSDAADAFERAHEKDPFDIKVRNIAACS